MIWISAEFNLHCCLFAWAFKSALMVIEFPWIGLWAYVFKNLIVSFSSSESIKRLWLLLSVANMFPNSWILIHRIQWRTTITSFRLNVSRNLISSLTYTTTYDTRAFRMRSYLWIIIICLKLRSFSLKFIIIYSMINTITRYWLICSRR